MGKITAITPQKHDKTRVSIELDGAYFCGLQMDTVLAYGLKTGKDVSEEELSEMQLKSEKSQALDKALSYVSKAMKTKKQVREYLQKKGYTPEVVAYCQERLTEYKFVDDGEYAAAFCRTYRDKKGAKAIERDLKLKGIDFRLVENAVGEIGSQKDAVKRIAEKYLKGKEPSRETAAKLYKHVLQKGFSYDDASYAVSLMKGEDEWSES